MTRMDILVQEPKQVLVTHAVLLWRTRNRDHDKGRLIEMFDGCDRQSLAEFIVRFYDAHSSGNTAVLAGMDENGWCDNFRCDTCHCTPSATHGDYGPSHPWDAPGMSVKDFI